MRKTPVIGFSACFFHADPQRAIFKGKTLMYFEKSMADWVMQEDAIPFLIPQATNKHKVKKLVDLIDGLILQGGSDVSPKSYGETPLRPEWQGDFIRDQYEITLVKECLKQDKPVLGICRGLQLLNVAFKGTLYQDINEQLPASLVHRNWDIYDDNHHELNIIPNTGLAKIYPKKFSVVVNSVHHQGICRLGKDLQIEAISPKDNIVEAIRYNPKGRKTPWVFAVQWHPEFHDRRHPHFLNSKPLLKDFLNEVRKRKKSRNN